MIPRQIRRHLWGMPEHELLVLGAVTQALRPDRVVEFGTFTGSSTLAMALNSPQHSRIVTVDVNPADRPSHVHGLGVGLLEFHVGEVFQGTAWHRKIEQRLGDTRQFVMPEWEGQVGLFLVDADHTYDFVRTDTAFAKKMLMPGGAILWHDYTWSPDAAECGGVTRAVNEFHQRYGNCFQIAGTRFALYFNTARG
jgi:predicted O-methyltransferase YrrM